MNKNIKVGIVGAGIQGISKCLLEGGEEILTEAATDYVDTAIGSLRRSSYGAYYGLISMSNSDLGQSLIGLTAGCMVRGVTGFDDGFKYHQ